MKKVFSAFAAVLALALVPAVPYTAFSQSTTPTAPSSFEAAVYPAADASKLWMVIDPDKDQTTRVRVELIDQKNNVLYTGTLPRQPKAYRQQFDLGSMTDGTYTLRIVRGEEVLEKTFRLTTPGLSEQLPRRYVTMN